LGDGTKINRLLPVQSINEIANILSPSAWHTCNHFIDIKCFGYSANDSNTCSGKGNCISNDNCKCNYGSFGNNCENDLNCFGKLYNESLVCSGNGSCTYNDICTCNLFFN
jgi:hypothetical protein